LPTDDEWKTIEMYLGMYSSQANSTGWRGTNEGGKLKEIGTTHWNPPNTGATNSSGFTCLPGGSHSAGSTFTDLTIYADFWTSSQTGSAAWYRFIGNNSAQVGRNNISAYGFSVRCVWD